MTAQIKKKKIVFQTTLLGLTTLLLKYEKKVNKLRKPLLLS